ncbi:hypothetical protein A3SI_20002 [Nitritalea halalkaliphila LW7]|uniref:Uncharacterized protein n=1 Tax=Nitritalea halalkaliphila LW7 TaxID=1189621 RepID=I5BRE8_9BACT|nr:hypothetical protein A3SI_20002 [Nitritalea halalkaliphila LW7]
MHEMKYQKKGKGEHQKREGEEIRSFFNYIGLLIQSWQIIPYFDKYTLDLLRYYMFDFYLALYLILQS